MYYQYIREEPAWTTKPFIRIPMIKSLRLSTAILISTIPMVWPSIHRVLMQSPPWWKKYVRILLLNIRGSTIYHCQPMMKSMSPFSAADAWYGWSSEPSSDAHAPSAAADVPASAAGAAAVKNAAGAAVSPLVYKLDDTWTAARKRRFSEGIFKNREIL